MSLTPGEIAATRRELAENLRQSGVSIRRLAMALDLDETHVQHALTLTEPVNAVDVWAVRDALTIAMRTDGRSGEEYSALTERIRPLAKTWFPLRDIPDTLFDHLAD